MPVEFKNVTKYIGKNKVLDDITVSIQSGKITGLKGINGSGKTMMMRLIAGLIYASAGSVIVDHKILGKDIAFPKNIGIMLENPAFLNGYSGYDNLRMLADIRKSIDEERIQQVMACVGLRENGNKKYGKFSLGMKQRLGIAAAIMEYPSILLLDEPTNALDEAGIGMVKEVILSERERGATVVLSSHDAGFLESVSECIVEISEGKVKKIYEKKEWGFYV